uniref:Uncharacterized protein n=1 Tax=Glossina pallidipes TaxID=7398 RepID=A0A1A9ZWR0_GLOPL
MVPEISHKSVIQTNGSNTAVRLTTEQLKCAEPGISKEQLDILYKILIDRIDYFTTAKKYSRAVYGSLLLRDQKLVKQVIESNAQGTTWDNDAGKSWIMGSIALCCPLVILQYIAGAAYIQSFTCVPIFYTPESLTIP